MRTAGRLAAAAALFLSAAVFQARSAGEEAAWPCVRLSCGGAAATVYRPDPENGFYRGTRFDLSGIIDNIESHGHSFFTRHHPGMHDPYGNDNVAGPAEEFDLDTEPPGFREAAPGGLFMKIGAGILVRPDEKEYFFNRRYEVRDRGVWSFRQTGSAEAEAVHELKMPDGSFGYRLERKISLTGDGSGLRIWRRLENTGNRPISTRHYSHNFICIDGRPAGSGYEVSVPFVPALDKPSVLPAAGILRGGTLGFSGGKLKRTFWASFKGFGDVPEHNSFIVTERESGAGIRISTNLPPSEFRVYADGRVVCPEMFCDIEVEPGGAAEWVTEAKFLFDGNASMRGADNLSLKK